MSGLFSINNPFWQFVNRLLHLFWLNLLWIFCSIPIITIGASTTAVYDVTMRMIRNEEGYTTKDFFAAFRANFKQATAIWIILLFIGIIIVADLFVYLRSTSISAVGMILMMTFFAAAVLFCFECFYVFAVLARFDNTTARTMGNALVMSIRHLPSSILMAASFVILAALGFLVFPPILLLGLPLTAWIHSFFLVKIFDRYEQTTSCED